jgi:hypothetical protein
VPLEDTDRNKEEEDTCVSYEEEDVLDNDRNKDRQ